MLKVATAVSAYPFYNFRYLKLLSEFSKYFKLYVFADSKLPRGKIREENVSYQVYYLVPHILPRRIQYFFGGLISQPIINLMKPHVFWLFDTSRILLPLVINCPLVLDIDDPVFDHRSKLSLMKDLYLLRHKKLVRIIVTTNIIKEKFVKYYGIQEDIVKVVPNGVDLNLFRPTKLPEEDVVLYYGTLALHRSRFLIKVVEETLKRRKDIKFIVIGDTPAWFKEYLTRKNMINNVILPGFVEHDLLPEWVKKAKICVFTQERSFGGRFPGKLIEYMACGRPIVATDVDESWPIKESGAGITTPLDPKIFSENIIKLLEDRKLAEELARKGIEYARKYDWNKMVKEYIKIFMEISEQKELASYLQR
mgnify:CR=1 FL=1